MKIAYVLDDTLDKSDGVQQAMIAIAEHMRNLGHDVHYIVPTTERTDLANVHVVATYVAMSFNGNSVRTPQPAQRKRVKQLLKTEKFDVLHVQMPFSPLLAGRVMKYTPKHTKIVGTFHILPYNMFSSIGTAILGMVSYRISRRFTSVYGVSAPAVRFMKKTYKLDGSVLGNPIDYNFFSKHGASLARDAGERVVFVGRFDERKGVKQLVEAFRRLHEQGETCEMIMCGKGPLLDELKAYSEKNGLPIQFKGFVTEEEKAQYLGSATIAVFPSTGGESFGIVLTEAMASGANITIGGNNHGYASVLEPWPDALFNANSAEEIALVLQKFLKDAKKRKEIGDAQHQYVRQFDVNTIVQHLLAEAY